MHTYRPFLWIVLAFGVGIGGGVYVVVPFTLVVFTVFVLMMIYAVVFRKPFLSSIVLLMVFVLLGMVFVRNYQTLASGDIVHVARYHRKNPVRLEGVVVSDVEKRNFFKGKKTMFTLQVKRVRSPWGWRKKSGKVLVNIFCEANVVYGDYLLLEGKLHYPYNFAPEERFSYREYLKRRGIHLILSVKKDSPMTVVAKGKGNYFRSVSLILRNKLKAILHQALSKNESGIMQAVLLGDRSQIPKHVRTLFVQTGTAHILAISGLHVGAVSGLFFIFLKMFPIGRRWQLGMTILLLIGYSFLTGGRPSVVRASVMICVFLMSFILEKESDSINTLSFAALVILLFNPFNLFDIGFQLSFACVVSIIMFSAKIKIILQKCFKIESNKTLKLTKVFIDSLSVSLSVWIGSTGLIAYHFDVVAPIAIVANLIVVPLISGVVVLGLGLLSVGGFWPFGLWVCAACLKFLLNVMVGVIYVFSKVPYANVNVPNISTRWVLGYYIVILLLFGIRWRRIFKA